MSTKTEGMQARIRENGERVKTWAPLPADVDPAALSKGMYRVEQWAHREAERACNGDMGGESFDTFSAKVGATVRRRLLRILPREAVERIFLNWDPRGYALKTKHNAGALYRDWGGYGILAPDVWED